MVKKTNHICLLMMACTFMHAITILTFLLLPIGVHAQVGTDSVASTHDLRNVEVKAQTAIKSKIKVTNTEIIGKNELFRAACCNLGESFTTNPSVDVSYTDAASGARQIKLLGLSGTYVQMMTENMPNFRGGCIPYSLSFVPGPWMQSIQVSKGASSVKNGFESITGQINIEYMKPQGIDGVRGNIYYDSKMKLEANADASVHITDNLSTSLLLHFEDRQKAHDGNHDGFMDMPKLRQYNVMNRWAWVSPIWISQLSVRALRDERSSGQMVHEGSPAMSQSIPLWTSAVTTNRFEAQWKNGFTINADRNESIALMLNGSIHDAKNYFGLRHYNFKQKSFYGQIMYERDFGTHHNLAVGGSFQHDQYSERTNFNYNDAFQTYEMSENLNGSSHKDIGYGGVYSQYTYKLDDKLTVMAGLRMDLGDCPDCIDAYFPFDGSLAPRLHIKYSPFDILTLRASAGHGWRRAIPLAENASILAMGRDIYIDGRKSIFSHIFHEAAWNYGLSASMNIPVAGRNLELNTEYYFTDFKDQMVINIDGAKGKNTINFEQLNGKSYSHTFQVDATYPFFEGFKATGAFRYNDARTTYDGVLRHRPLTSLYKGLITLSYKLQPLELWQFDLTGHVNGKGYLYDYTTYPTYFQLQAQVTRQFRHFDIYIGGENLTGYKMKNPIIDAANPWSKSFDATQIWGPMDGAMFYIGINFKFEKL